LVSTSSLIIKFDGLQLYSILCNIT
jgi:hypothetical protein